MWGIWDIEADDWVREMPSKVDDGGEAILAFESETKARKRAAQHWCYTSYFDAKRDGWCEVRRLIGETANDERMTSMHG